MTPKRWLIVAFWVFVLVMCAKGIYDWNAKLVAGGQPEKHYFAEPLPTPAAPPQTQDADVRQTNYDVKINSTATAFTVNVTVKNFGQKKAANIQVRVTPYHGNVDNSKTEPGPDEVLNPTSSDPLASTYQWLAFPDLAPGDSETQSLTFPMRQDADPSAPPAKPQVTFSTVQP